MSTTDLARFALAIVIAAFCCSPNTGAAQSSYPKPQISSAAGEKAPDFTLKDQDGNPFILAKQHDAWILLYFYRGYW